MRNSLEWSAVVVGMVALMDNENVYAKEFRAGIGDGTDDQLVCFALRLNPKEAERIFNLMSAMLNEETHDVSTDDLHREDKRESKFFPRRDE